MKQQLVGLLKVLLFMFCIIVVLWQVFMGTRKYLEAPVANKIFAEEVELPDFTVCHLKKSLRVASKYGLDYDDYSYGRMFPEENYNISMEDMFEEALNEHYYLLDITGIRQLVINIQNDSDSNTDKNRT